MSSFVSLALLSMCLPAALCLRPGGTVTFSRRALVSGLTHGSVLISQSAEAEPFSKARLLTIGAKRISRPSGGAARQSYDGGCAGEYLGDVKDARRGLEDLQPLLERSTDSGNEAVRIALRKAPVSGIRKACSKVLVFYSVCTLFSCQGPN